MYYHRSIEDCWGQAAKQFQVLLLTGPRQVGKTTLLEHLCEAKRRYVTLDDFSLRTLAREDPALFLQRFPPPVLIDEIQYAPELLPHIKITVDRHKRPGAFWLTGSQQFQMMKGISESLAGRVAVINLLGFSARERLQSKSSVPPFLPTADVIKQRAKSSSKTDVQTVYENIWYGSFPALATGQIRDRALFYSSYTQTYLQRDVRDLAHVGNLETFTRFLKACAARTGQMLNLSDIARDTDVSVMTAKHWLSILVAGFQVYLLQPYHSNITKRLYKTPKLYFLDTGLCSYLTEWSSARTLAAGAMAGALFETYVFAEILKSWWHRMKFPSLYYYRDKEGREIDLLILQDGVMYPVEVKKAATVQRVWIKIFSTLNRFAENTGPGAVVCLSPDMLPLDESNTVIPVGYI
jgi:uncharacterized protein